MNSVDPIRDKKLIVDIADYLYIRTQRDWLMFLFGIYTAYRISDILPYKVRDVRGVKEFYIRDKKTGKENKLEVHDHLKWAIEQYIEGMQDYEYLFASRQKNARGVNAPISRQQAYNILTKAGKQFGLKRIGCHTLRKTFGYHYYKDTGDIMTLKEILNHGSIEETKKYIGLTQDSKNKALTGMDYGFKFNKR